MLPSADPAKRVFTFRKPNGVYALITPWNFPMNIPAELLAAALAAGNPAILKPSEETPLSAMALGKAACEAGFPDGSVSIVHGGRSVEKRSSPTPGSTASASWARTAPVRRSCGRPG